MSEHVDVVVIGGGQAGLAAGHELARAGLEHVVLERGRIGQTWSGRWDSFCLVTPNWATRLPGFPYDGDEPDGYARRDEVVAYLERYAATLDAPVRAEVEATSVNPRGDGFDVRTSVGDMTARSVVMATGAYQSAHRPEGAATLPGGLVRMDAEEYRNPSALPAGAVLVVGSGQTGCQIAEELVHAGREVVLSCGKAPWSPRRIGDRDLFWWGAETGFLDAPLSSLPTPAARLAANGQATGRDGGHDLHFRTLRRVGVTLAGHFLGVEGTTARFADDLAASVAWGDERYAQLVDMVRNLVEERGLPDPQIPDPGPFDPRSPLSADLSGFGAVVFAGGYRPAYGDLIRVPEAFDQFGFPVHEDGESTVVPGLFFVGVHFLRKRKSSLLFGVGEDAAIVAGRVASRHGAPFPSSAT